MFGTGRKLTWQGIAVTSLVVIVMGIIVGRVVDRQIFDKNLDRSAAFVESLRPNRPEGIGADEWNESINVTVTALYNVCTYDPKTDKSKKITGEILLLTKSPQNDPLGNLCKIWRILYTTCNPKTKPYLDKNYNILKKATGLDCV